VVGQAVLSGAVQAVAAGLPERLAPAVVFVVGGLGGEVRGITARLGSG
jgi:hypothetical protein